MTQDAVRDDAGQEGHASQLGHNPEGGTLVAEAGHRGHVRSWVCVVLVCAGFAVGGIGIVAGGNLLLVGIGIVAIVIGGLVGLVSDIFADVVLDSPRVLPELAHTTRKGAARLRTAGTDDPLPELPENTEKPRLL